MAASRILSSDYLEWAKTRSCARYNLATSGVFSVPLRELGVTLDDLELSAPGAYGYPPLLEALAARYGVAAERIVATHGTSLANHLVMAATLEPGDAVLIEEPAYEPLVALARYLRAEVVPLPRRAADGFRIDPAEARRRLTPRTRLVVLTNLHNPTGVLTDRATLEALGEAARRVGARVLVDEVYLDMCDLPGAGAASARPAPASGERSARHFGDPFVVTSSLTKTYGLSGLRCGWVVADPGLARRLWRLTDLFDVIPPHAAERLSVAALGHLDAFARRAGEHLRANRALLDRFLDARRDLETVRPPWGTVAFPRWRGGDADRLCALLRSEHETSVVPGRFFGLHDHVRIGIGCETATVAAGLERLGAALDALGRA